MTRIEMRELRKEYGGHVAIPDLNLDVEDGEFFTLLGPSGCGKTTLLRMIAGFNSIESGTIAFDGDVINDRAPAARNIGMVFQNYALFPQMSAAKNVAFGLEARKLPRAEGGARVTAALDDVRMAHLADRLPGAMSGGQQQRVALARALVIQPAVLLMDEPLSNLDAKLRVEMRDTIRKAQKDAGITTVYVTHDQEEAMAVSDRIAVMSEGVVQQVGPPEDIYHRPANVFVAEFIGKTNLLKRRIDWRSGRPLLGLDTDTSIDLTGHITEEIVTDVIVSVRPEGIAASDTGGITASVVDEVFLGSHTHVRAQLRTGEVVDFLDFSLVGARWSAGQEIRLVIDPVRINVFSAASTDSMMVRAS